MTLIYRDRPKIRLGVDEVHGLLNVLDDAIDKHEANGELSTMYYEGARAALTIIYRQERVEYPQEFMLLFDAVVKELEDWRDNAED